MPVDPFTKFRIIRAQTAFRVSKTGLRNMPGVKKITTAHMMPETTSRNEGPPPPGQLINIYNAELSNTAKRRAAPSDPHSSTASTQPLHFINVAPLCCPTVADDRELVNVMTCGRREKQKR